MLLSSSDEVDYDEGSLIKDCFLGSTTGQIKFKENNKIKLPNKCKAQIKIYVLIFMSRKKIKGRTRDSPNSRSDVHE